MPPPKQARSTGHATAAPRLTLRTCEVLSRTLYGCDDLSQFHPVVQVGRAIQCSEGTYLRSWVRPSKVLDSTSSRSRSGPSANSGSKPDWAVTTGKTVTCR